MKSMFSRPSVLTPRFVSAGYKLSTVIVVGLDALCLIAAVPAIYANNSTWKAAPVNGDLSNPDNWNCGCVPTEQVFRTSSVTNIYNFSGTSSMLFKPDASAYTLSQSVNNVEINEPGITNNSGFTQTFTLTSFEGFFISGSATTGKGTL